MPETAAPLPREEIPSWYKRLLLGLIDLPGVFLRGVPPFLRARREMKHWLAQIGSDVDKYASPGKAPKTMFNAVLSPRRTFSAYSLPLTTLAPIRAAHDVTINDIVLALVAGSARRRQSSRSPRSQRSNS